MEILRALHLRLTNLRLTKQEQKAASLQDQRVETPL